MELETQDAINKQKMKEKHLDYIQAVITRHNSNSFMIKGWAITLCTAVLTLAATWKEPVLALVAIVPTLLFWILDSKYLANERCFVSLYNAAVNENKLVKTNDELHDYAWKLTKNEKGEDIKDPKTEVEFFTSDYSMDFTPFKKIKRNNWQATFGSPTIIWFYLMLVGFTALLFIGLLILTSKKVETPLKVRAFIEMDSSFKGEPVIAPPVVVPSVIDTVHAK